MDFEAAKYLYDRYNGELRPLVAEVEGRLEKFEEPLLQNIYKFFNSIVEGDNNAAKDAMNLCVMQSYKYLSYALFPQIIKFKKCYSSNQLQPLLQGSFVGQFLAKIKQAKTALKSADYKLSYQELSDAEILIISASPELIGSISKTKEFYVSAVKWIASVAISIIVGGYVGNLFLILLNG